MDSQLKSSPCLSIEITIGRNDVEKAIMLALCVKILVFQCLSLYFIPASPVPLGQVFVAVARVFPRRTDFSKEQGRLWAFNGVGINFFGN